MGRAMALAERGGGGTSPNPMVGCVIVDGEGRILGEGYHARAGGPHAEAVALAAAAAAGRDVRGATAVITLEPCAHLGRTASCAQALAAAGIGRVVYAMGDPADGKGGKEQLAAAGIPSTGGVCEAEARRLNEAWLHYVEAGRPFFHLKTAQTLNGRVTRGREGERWVTGPESRAAVHRLRRRHAGILVGVNTVLADDPLLTVRAEPVADGDEPAWPAVQPLRAVLDSHLRVPAGSRLVQSVAEGPLLIFCAAGGHSEREAELEDHGVEIVRVPTAGKGLDLMAVAEDLAHRGVTGVFVEPGPTLATALLEAGLADRWTIFLAPDWVTARGALPLLLTTAPHVGFSLADAEWDLHGRDASVSGRIRGV